MIWHSGRFGKNRLVGQKGCGVMPWLIGGVISTGKAVYERATPVQPSSVF